MVKGLLIDFGGTIDTDGLHWLRMFEMSYQSLGLPVTGFRDAYVYAERTLGNQNIIKPDFSFRNTLREKIHLQLEYLCMKADADSLLDFCYSYVSDNIRNVSAPVLREISEQIPVALVSNFYGNMHTVLREFAIDGCFTDVIESAVVGVRKPDPEIFRLGAETLGLEPEDTVAVGDSPDKDIIPASEAGCHTVWLSGRGWSDAVTCQPERTITTLSNLQSNL